MSFGQDQGQTQLVETASLVAGAIGLIVVVVMVAWGFRQMRRSVRGEPLEEPPLPLPEF